MADIPNLAECTPECRKWFARTPEAHRELAHKGWHESHAWRVETDVYWGRDYKAPIRRWYAQATVDEVERWHEEMDKNHNLIRRLQNIFALPFGHSWIFVWLNARVQSAVYARQERRNAARVSTLPAQSS